MDSNSRTRRGSCPLRHVFSSFSLVSQRAVDEVRVGRDSAKVFLRLPADTDTHFLLPTVKRLSTASDNFKAIWSLTKLSIAEEAE
jgi:hypothetical protein